MLFLAVHHVCAGLNLVDDLVAMPIFGLSAGVLKCRTMVGDLLGTASGPAGFGEGITILGGL
jgi:hypothetical protein